MGLWDPYPAPVPGPDGIDADGAAERETSTRTATVAALWAAGALIFVGVRLSLLNRRWDRLDVEELRFGLLPHDLWRGLALPLPEYQTMLREGGSILMAPVVALAMAAGGDTLLSLKLGAILWNLIGWVLWTAATLKHVGGRAAVALGLLGAVGGAWWAGSQILGVANHGEAMVLLAVPLLLLPRRGEAPSTASGVAVLVGAALAGSFAWSVVPAAGICVVSWLAAAGWRRFAPLSPLLLIGSWPVLSWTQREGEWGRLRGALVEDGLISSLLGVPRGGDLLAAAPVGERLLPWVQVHGFAMWSLPWQAPGHPGGAAIAAGWALTALTIGAWTLALWSWRSLDALSRCCVLIVPLQGLVVVAAGFPLGPDVFDGYRYLLPLLWPASVLVAQGIARELSAGRGRLRWIRASLVLATLLGVHLWSLGGGGGGGVRAMSHLRGWNVLPIASHIENHADDRWISALIDERPEDRAALTELRGRAAAWRNPVGPPPCTDLAEACRLRIEGWVHAIGSRTSAQGMRLEPLRSALGQLRVEQGGALLSDGLRGLGRSVAVHPPEAFWLQTVIPQFESLLQPGEVPYFHEGIGLQECLGRDFHYVRQWGGGLMPHHDHWALGLGRGFARIVVSDAPFGSAELPRTLVPWVDASPTAMAAFRQGLVDERQRLDRLDGS